MASVPDLSNLRALIADDRPEVRDWLAAKLRELGVTRIESVPSGTPGPLLSLTTASSMPAAAEPRTPEQLSDLVSRFTHDVMNPLQSALVFSRFLATTPGATGRDTAADDLKAVHAAVEEVAGMVGQLIERLVAASRTRRPGAS